MQALTAQVRKLVVRIFIVGGGLGGGWVGGWGGGGILRGGVVASALCFCGSDPNVYAYLRSSVRWFSVSLCFL